MVWSSARPSSGFRVSRNLVWPCPGDLRKARFILRDNKEVVLWHFLGESGVSMESDLTQTRVRLEEALERVKFVHRAVTVDLPHAAEVSSL